MMFQTRGCCVPSEPSRPTAPARLRAGGSISYSGHAAVLGLNSDRFGLAADFEFIDFVRCIFVVNALCLLIEFRRRLGRFLDEGGLSDRAGGEGCQDEDER